MIGIRLLLKTLGRAAGHGRGTKGILYAPPSDGPRGPPIIAQRLTFADAFFADLGFPGALHLRRGSAAAVHPSQALRGELNGT